MQNWAIKITVIFSNHFSISRRESRSYQLFRSNSITSHGKDCSLVLKVSVILAQGFCELARIPSVIESYVPDLKLTSVGTKRKPLCFH